MQRSQKKSGFAIGRQVVCVRHLALSAIFLVWPLQAGVAEAGQRIALVIGNGGYLNTSQLPNPPADAELMERTLGEAGFEVQRLTDAGQSDMKRAMLDFGRALRGPDVEAGLFYYAGHGVQVNGENYLVPVDAQISSDDEIDLEAININDFLAVMNSSNSFINIVILDACRNNPFARSFRSVSRGLAPVDAPKGTLIAYSTAPGDVALDGDGSNSPYTLALSRAITNGKGRTVESVFKTARRNVLSETEDRQVPWETSSVTGDFYFVPDNSKAAQPTPTHPAPTQPAPTQPALEWLHYVNGRYGTSADIPGEFLADPPPANGDGQRFTSPLGGTISVFGAINFTGGGLNNYRGFLKETMESDGWKLTYTPAGPNWFVLSGVKGSEIAYVRAEQPKGCASDIIHQIDFRYPTRDGKAWEPIVKKGTASLQGPCKQ